jgi:four helix bundle protein
MGDFQGLRVWQRAKELAKGSSAELLTQAIIAHEIGHLEKQYFDHVKTECQAISGMLTRLIQSRSTDT